MILSIAHTKGGVGKTTTAIQLATYLKVIKKIKDVLLIDADSQHSAQNAISRRNEAEEIKLECDLLADAKALQTQLEIKKDRYKQIIIDLGARNSDTLRAALMLSNAVLIPFQPNSFALEAYLDEFQTVYEQAKSFGSKCKLYGFLNFAEPQGSSNDETKAYIENFEDIQFLDCHLTRRKSIMVSTSFGRSVFEEKPRDLKACAEIESLAEILFK